MSNVAQAIAAASATEVARVALGSANFSAFMFGGKAVFTIQNVTSGARITFSVEKAKKRTDREIHYVYANLLGDGDKNWVYLGAIYDKNKFYWSETKSDQLENSPGVNTIKFLVRVQHELHNHTTYAIYHEGMCCRCGRPLTTPESILAGYGPECQRRAVIAGVAPARQTKAKNPRRVRQ